MTPEFRRRGGGAQERKEIIVQAISSYIYRLDLYRQRLPDCFQFGEVVRPGSPGKYLPLRQVLRSIGPVLPGTALDNTIGLTVDPQDGQQTSSTHKPGKEQS